MSRQMERILFGLCTARQRESLIFFARSEGSNEAGGIANRNGKVLRVLRLPFQNQSEPRRECERLENMWQFTIWQASVTTGNVIGCGIYQDKRGSITLQQFPVIKAR